MISFEIIRKKNKISELIANMAHIFVASIIVLLFNCLLEVRVEANLSPDQIDSCAKELRQNVSGQNRATRLLSGLSGLSQLELELRAANPNLEGGAKLSRLLANKDANLKLKLGFLVQRSLLAQCNVLSGHLIKPIVESKQCGAEILALIKPTSSVFAQIVADDSGLDQLLSYMEICRLVASPASEDTDDEDDDE